MNERPAEHVWRPQERSAKMGGGLQSFRKWEWYHQPCKMNLPDCQGEILLNIEGLLLRIHKHGISRGPKRKTAKMEEQKSMKALRLDPKEHC